MSHKMNDIYEESKREAEQEKDLGQTIFNLIRDLDKLTYLSHDNLFSANHRNAMIKRYGATSAQRITIGELLKS